MNANSEFKKMGYYSKCPKCEYINDITIIFESSKFVDIELLTCKNCCKSYTITLAR